MLKENLFVDKSQSAKNKNIYLQMCKFILVKWAIRISFVHKYAVMLYKAYHKSNLWGIHILLLIVDFYVPLFDVDLCIVTLEVIAHKSENTMM